MMSVLLRNTANRCLLPVRLFSKNSVRFEKSPASSAQAQVQSGKLSGKTHQVNNLEKRFLVWTGKFKNIKEVPELIAPETMEKARNKMRIRIANIMMVVILLTCFGMAISGKRAAEKGETIQKSNIEWHRRINEEAKK